MKGQAMTRPAIFWILGLVALALTGTASASDHIRLVAGQTINGDVTEMSSTEVKVDASGVPKNYSVNQIESIQFDDEPKELTTARNALRGGKYAEAVAAIKRVSLTDVKREEIKQDVEFYKALLLARLALAGNGSLKEAGKHLFDFEKAHKNNYHYLEASATLGDLLVATGNVDKAETYYARLGATPWPEYRIRAAVLAGRALESQKLYERAIAKYDEALEITGEGSEVENQRLTAQLGKATSLAASDKVDEAVTLIREVIDKADTENSELYARAYVALGNCYKTAGKPKDALLAFLEVDLLYPNSPEQHAEALANLTTLWAKVDKADRAAQARAQLQQRYPNSRWVKEAKEAAAPSG
jgi:tetratricopeptide (TPR) repeat protein